MVERNCPQQTSRETDTKGFMMHEVIVAGSGRGYLFASILNEYRLFKDRCHVAAMVDIAKEHHAGLREKLDRAGLHNTEICTTLDEALAKYPKEKADAVLVVTPNTTHAELAEKTLAADRNLLLEKPIAADWEDARRILHAARGSSRTIQLGFVLRYSHFYQKLHELSKQLGHIVMIQSNERLSFDHSSAYRRGWRRHLSATGGLMNEKCCHDLDIIRWLKKKHAEPVSVYSIGGYDLFPEHPEKPLYCEDCSDSKCVFRRDIEKLKQNLNVNLDVYRQCIYHTDADVMTNQSATILFDDGTQAIFTIALYAGSDEQRDIRILGTEGQLIGDLKYGRIELLLYRENTHEIFELPGGMHGDGDPLILDDFFRCIDEKKQPEATVEDGVLASRIAFAANLSVKERRIVNLDEFPL